MAEPMTDGDDPAEGADPLPGVDLTADRPYPLLLERLVTLACLLTALLLIRPTLAADFPIGGPLQILLAFCGLPILGFGVARLLLIPIQLAANRQ
jgi:hypothetical protein